tara:strand:+ start:1090 stop:1353 length:264 start_codon:yes stop_codon:yes gene_type:complete
MPKKKKPNRKQIESLLTAKSSEQLKREIEEELAQEITDPVKSLADLIAEEEERKKEDKIIAKQRYREQELETINLMDRDEPKERFRF